MVPRGGMNVISLIAKRRPGRRLLMVLVGVVCAASLVGVTAAYGSSLTDAVAGRAAKRAAVRHVGRLGLSYPYREWTAFCLQWTVGSYGCTVATRGGQCHGRLVVYGSAQHPRTRARRIDCGE